MRIEQVGLDAKQQLIGANLRLVVSIAKRYIVRHAVFGSYSRGANLGLIRGSREVRLYQGI